ncbi:MAG: hypothetical protein QM703_12960 [Gemmatales bacterium]
MNTNIARASLCLILALSLAPLCHADEAETLKKIKKAGGFAGRVGNEYGAAFDSNKATEENLSLLLELPKVTSLRLSDNTKMTVGCFQIIGRLKHLKQLHIFKSNITDEELKELSGLENLEEIILDATQITGPGAAALSNMKKLTKVRLNGPTVTNAALKHLQPIPNLYSLDLSDTKVTDAGLNDLKGMKKMGRLSLQGTAITDSGLKIFYDTDAFGRLAMLTVSKTKVTKEAANDLKKARSTGKKGFSITT